MKLPPFPVQPGPTRALKSRPGLGSGSQTSLESHYSSSPVTKQTLEHVQEECDYDLPLSKEAKSPAYPDGPICIYDPSVFLFLEPSKIEASNFDVIINVAREVLNPFAPIADNDPEPAIGNQAADVASSPCGLSIQPGPSAGRENMSEPQTAVSDNSFASALESQIDDTPRTEPPPSLGANPGPEYIHIPWDHNTNVVEDLLHLCELIDDRVHQKKRVLVHCQCGVSRSASLIVAYGLYKNPQLTVQEAYDAVKGRSRWIGPNMNLIYQLSEFKSKLSRPSSTTGSASWHSWRLNSSRSGLMAPDLAPISGASLSKNDARDQPPLSAPFRNDHNLLVPKRADTLDQTSSVSLSERTKSGAITPGPSSAPPDMHWSMDFMSAKGFPSSTREPNGEQTSGAFPLTLEPSNAQNQDLASPNVLDSMKSPTSSSFPVSISGPERLREGSRIDLLPTAMDVDTSQQSFFSPLPLSPSLPSRMAVVPSSQASMPTQQLRSHPSPPVRAPPRPKPSLSLKPSSDSLGGFGFHRLAPSPSATQTPAQQPRTLPLRQDAPHFPFANPSPQVALVSDDPPPTPSLLSPRAVEFTSSPFHRTVAGDLAGSSVFEQGQSPSVPTKEAAKPSPMNLGFALAPSNDRGIARKKSTIFEQLQGVPSNNLGEVSEQTIEILPQPRDERAKDEDPRSPVNIEGEAGVVRSIFDVI